MARLTRRWLKALIEYDRGGWSWARFGIWTLGLKELGRIYLVQVTADGLGLVASDMGWSSVVDGGSGVLQLGLYRHIPFRRI